MNIEIFIIPLDKCKVCIYRRISILLNMEIFIITLDWINATRTNVSKYRIETFIVLFSRLVEIYWISACRSTN